MIDARLKWEGMIFVGTVGICEDERFVRGAQLVVVGTNCEHRSAEVLDFASCAGREVFQHDPSTDNSNRSHDALKIDGQTN